MGIKHDKLWVVLHKTHKINDYISGICDALVPDGCTQEEVDLLVIFYINLIKTDAILYEKLDKKDYYNMYNFLPNIIVNNGTNAIDFKIIENNLRNLNLFPCTRDYGLIEALLGALSIIIESL